jgi:predicted nucleotidyltransferase component of viral defense system
MIPPSEIARRAHRLSLGDTTIEQDYVMTWVLLAIANSPLRDRLAFKGDTALKKVYEPDYRFSEDLGFTLLVDTPNEDLVAVIEALFPWLRREVNILLDVRRTEIHQTGSPTIYLNYVGPLRGDLGSRFLKTDFTRHELLLFPPATAALQSPYSDCRGRTETLLVYTPEEILAEKLCALLGRTEPRDLYDVHYMLTQRLADAVAVSFRIGEKMAHKGLDPAGLEHVLARKRDTFDRLWDPRLRGQMPDPSGRASGRGLPHLDMVIRETNRWLRQSGLV